jgi:hypothetical protein
MTMIHSAIVGLLILLLGCSGSRLSSISESQNGNGHNTYLNSKSGLKIEYGPNLGTTHTDKNGIKNFYVHITAIITNELTRPIHLQLALAKEYKFPSFCGKATYKVFLLPEELSPDTATIYNNIVNGQHDFLNTPLENSNTLYKTLKPEEYCVVTIGVLIPKSSNCAAVPRAVFSPDNKGQYDACDRHISTQPEDENKAISIDPLLELGVKLEYYNQRKFIAPEDGCAIIPFGQITFPDR